MKIVYFDVVELKVSDALLELHLRDLLLHPVLELLKLNRVTSKLLLFSDIIFTNNGLNEYIDQKRNVENLKVS